MMHAPQHHSQQPSHYRPSGGNGGMNGGRPPNPTIDPSYGQSLQSMGQPPSVMSAAAALHIQAAALSQQQQQQQQQQHQQMQRFPRRHSAADTFNNGGAGGFSKRSTDLSATVSYQNAWEAEAYANMSAAAAVASGTAGLNREAYAALLQSQHALNSQQMSASMMNDTHNLPKQTSSTLPRNFSSQRHQSFSGAPSNAGPLSPVNQSFDSNFYPGSTSNAASPMTAHNAGMAYAASLAALQQQQQQLNAMSQAAAAAAAAFAAAQQQQQQQYDPSMMMLNPSMALQLQQHMQQLQQASRPGPNSKQHRRRALSSDATLGMAGMPTIGPNGMISSTGSSPTSSTASSPSAGRNALPMPINVGMVNQAAAFGHPSMGPNGPLSPKSRGMNGPPKLAGRNGSVSVGGSPQRVDAATPTDEGPSMGGRKLDKEQKKVNLYKTELCRSWEETGDCRYGTKCQFAHSQDELRVIERHPKYKTQMCKTFWEKGTCPYGKRCCFIHTPQTAANMRAAMDDGNMVFGDPDLVFGGPGSQYYDASMAPPPTPTTSVPTTPISATLPQQQQSVIGLGVGVGPRRVSLDRTPMPMLSPAGATTLASPAQSLTPLHLPAQQQLVMDAFPLHSVPEEGDDDDHDGPLVPASVVAGSVIAAMDKLRISPPLPVSAPTSSSYGASTSPPEGSFASGTKKNAPGRLAVGSLPRLNNNISSFLLPSSATSASSNTPAYDSNLSSAMSSNSNIPPPSFAGTPYPFTSNSQGYFDFGTPSSSGPSALSASAVASDFANTMPAQDGRRTRSVTQPIRMYGSLPRDASGPLSTASGPLSPPIIPSTIQYAFNESSFRTSPPVPMPASSLSSSLPNAFATQLLSGSPPPTTQAQGGAIGERRPSAPMLGSTLPTNGKANNAAFGIGREANDFENHLMAFRQMG